MDAEEMALLIPIIAVLIPFWAIYWRNRGSHLKIEEQRETRRAYERIVTEKLDVIKTAVAMGYTDEELDALDARLERLVGTDKLRTLLEDQQPHVPHVTHELLDTDLDAEVARVGRKQRESRRA